MAKTHSPAFTGTLCGAKGAVGIPADCKRCLAIIRGLVKKAAKQSYPARDRCPDCP